MQRSGLGRLEVIVIVAVVVLITALAGPTILASRESARRMYCVRNLQTLGTALHQYHDVHQSLPPAAIWHAGPLKSLMLDQSRQIDIITHQNWAQLLLPYIGRDDLAQQFDRTRPIGDDNNERARTTSLSEMTCPSDDFNRSDNPYRFEFRANASPQVEFARGNYAINGGTQCHRSEPGTPARPCGEGVRLFIDEDRRIFQHTGSGVAAINQAFSLNDFHNGQSTLVAIEEVRAGIHPLDPRGVWSLGQVGGSITFAHGVSGDAGSPNNQWDRSDDLLGCGRLHAEVGSETLLKERMPCAHYIDRNDQATARSLHPNGVNVLFLDGAVRFITDEVDRGLWHVMHSRETPKEILEEDFESRVTRQEPPAELSSETAALPRIDPEPGTLLTNSLGMSFVAIPAGEFQMGIPDIGNDGPPPPETPIHTVKIPRSLWFGQHEVTQQAFLEVMGHNPSFHRAGEEMSTDSGQFPVEQVTWFDADEFCRRLSDLPAERAAGRRYRLPTEAEWEYACRSGKSEAYDWRTGRHRNPDSGETAGVEPALPIAAVGSYPPNAFGLYDMRGNVWEWCADWFDRSYYSRSPLVNPQGPQTGYLKVLRGGDWIFVGEVCRINYPIIPPWKSNRYIGFRVICETTR